VGFFGRGREGGRGAGQSRCKELKAEEMSD